MANLYFSFLLSFQGTQHGYHLLTFGLYINEIIMRVDPQHRTVDQFFMEEIGEPLGKYINCYKSVTRKAGTSYKAVKC